MPGLGHCWDEVGHGDGSFPGSACAGADTCASLSMGEMGALLRAGAGPALSVHRRSRPPPFAAPAPFALPPSPLPQAVGLSLVASALPTLGGRTRPRPSSCSYSTCRGKAESFGVRLTRDNVARRAGFAGGRSTCKRWCTRGLPRVGGQEAGPGHRAPNDAIVRVTRGHLRLGPASVAWVGGWPVPTAGPQSAT